MRMSTLAAIALAALVGCTYHGACDREDDGERPCLGDGCARTDAGAGAHDGGGMSVDPDAGGASSGGCGETAPCEVGEVCVEGACHALDDVCHHDLDCGRDRRCIDNACRPACDDDSTCVAGTACVAGVCRPVVECGDDGACSAPSTCVDARCLAPCDATSDCGADEVCTAGSCRPDTAPRPFCSSDDDCAPGHPCVDGVCRTRCPSGTDDECLRSDVHLVQCVVSHGGDPLCLTQSEVDPECVTRSDCPVGQSCLDAICR